MNFSDNGIAFSENFASEIIFWIFFSSRWTSGRTNESGKSKKGQLSWMRNNTENLKNHIKIAQLYRFFSIAIQKSCFELYFKLVQEAYLFNLFLLKIVKERRGYFWTIPLTLKIDKFFSYIKAITGWLIISSSLFLFIFRMKVV